MSLLPIRLGAFGYHIEPVILWCPRNILEAGHGSSSRLDSRLNLEEKNASCRPPPFLRQFVLAHVCPSHTAHGPSNELVRLVSQRSPRYWRIEVWRALIGDRELICQPLDVIRLEITSNVWQGYYHLNIFDAAVYILHYTGDRLQNCPFLV